MTVHDPPATDARRILEALVCSRNGCECRGAARRGRGATHCPAHSDVGHPSLSISDRDGKLLVNCKSGCAQNAVVAALRERRLWPNVRAERAESDPIAYEYRDEAGALLYQAIRRPGKRFVFRRRNRRGEWLYELGDVRRVLYHLPELAGADPAALIFVTEGEKDADRLAALGLLATTNPGGAGKWRADYNAPFRGHEVAILVDNDEPGRKHAAEVARQLRAVGAAVRTIELPGLPPKGDVSDWLDQGHSVDELNQFVMAQERRNGHDAAGPPPRGPTEDQAEPPPKLWPRTDAGNGELFAHLYGEQLRYDHTRSRWLLWRPDQHRWVPDLVDEVHQLAKLAARRRYQDAVHIEDLVERAMEAKHAIASEARGKIDAMLGQAMSEPPIADAGYGWDANPWLLGVANGVIDLQTCTLRDGKLDDRITRQIAIAYDAAAAAPRWQRFLLEVFAGDEDLVEFVRSATGYSLTGLTREQCILLCHGSGANGKSTFLRTLRLIAGPYGHNMPFTALEPSTRNLNDVADLYGKRLVTASESNEATRLNEARVKALTGDETITGRQLYERAFEFRPEAKIWLATNHLPRVSDNSHGFWRRIHTLPFTQQFDPHAEPNLEQTLISEAPGILAWAIEGVRQWNTAGLHAPTRVTEATLAYRREQDTLLRFVDDSCVTVENASVGASALYRHYLEWAHSEGQSERERLTSTGFGRRMAERFSKTHAHDGWRYLGIGIRTVFDTTEPATPRPIVPVCEGCGEPEGGTRGKLTDVGGVYLHDNCSIRP